MLRLSHRGVFAFASGFSGCIAEGEGGATRIRRHGGSLGCRFVSVGAVVVGATTAAAAAVAQMVLVSYGCSVVLGNNGACSLS